MGVFQWEEMYSVQVASVDRQHRGLFRAANELNEALLAGCGKDVAGKILQRLIDYTASHFCRGRSGDEYDRVPGARGAPG